MQMLGPDSSGADNSVVDSESHPGRTLFLLSFLMLFVELALIRWLSESILYLGFFTNIVLIASFLGIGVGFLSKHEPTWIRWLPTTLFLLIALVMVFPVQVDRSAADVLFIGSGEPSGLPIWLILPLVFLASATTMAMIAQRAAHYFKRFDGLMAYRLDIIGSLTGIVGFAWLSALRTPPIVWGAVVAIVIVFTSWRLLPKIGRVATAGFLVLLAGQSATPGWSWSPYYRVEVLADETFKYISVNGIPHQATGTIAALRELDWLADWPYRVRQADQPPRNVLIVGAGSGNDVAFALEAGADRVDAVEIDPRIYELGIELNPEKPYDDHRVAVHIDDGRAFMQRAELKWDLVVFALPDSLTSVAGQSSLRLESYLFTTEAFSRARDLLTSHGMFALYNTHSEQWVVDRMARTMLAVFGTEPCMLGSTTRSRVMLAVGPGVDPDCSGGRFISGSGAPDPVTDDRPYLYMRNLSIPAFYLGALAGIIAIAVIAVRIAAGGTTAIRNNLDLFLMGAAFLLLETKSVAQFALWFGTTWQVNVFVFAGVLASVLAAIEVSRRWRPRADILYLVLIASIMAVWSVPPSQLLVLSAPIRWIAAVLLTFPPIFVANLIFADRFRQAASTTDAFGANLLGAIVGGVLEYSTLVIGHRALSLAVGGFYIGAFLAWKRATGRLQPVPA
jgi:SAM-dependent methyltransferase